MDTCQEVNLPRPLQVSTQRTHGRSIKEYSNTRRITARKLSEGRQTICASLLREIQKGARFNQAQLSSLCHISLSTLYRIADGRTQKPSAKTCNRLLDLYCLLCGTMNNDGGQSC